MMENEIVYTMNPLEYMLMCVFADMEQIYGSSIEIGNIPDETLIQTVYEMERKKMIHQTTGGFRPMDQYLEIFHLIQNTDICLRVYSADILKPEILVYHSDKKIVCLKSAVHNSWRLQIEILNQQEFYEYLLNQGFLPNSSGFVESGEINEAIQMDLKREIGDWDLQGSIQELRNTSKFHSLIERATVADRVVEQPDRLFCCRLGIWDTYILIQGNLVKQEYGGRSVFEKFIRELLVIEKEGK